MSLPVNVFIIMYRKYFFLLKLNFLKLLVSPILNTVWLDNDLTF